jgi:hypothetical protein
MNLACSGGQVKAVSGPCTLRESRDEKDGKDSWARLNPSGSFLSVSSLPVPAYSLSFSLRYNVFRSKPKILAARVLLPSTVCNTCSI